jgi:hypothetical protein
MDLVLSSVDVPLFHTPLNTMGLRTFIKAASICPPLGLCTSPTGRSILGAWSPSIGRIGKMRYASDVNREGWVATEDFKATYARYKIVSKDWINGGGTAGDWLFSGPV